MVILFNNHLRSYIQFCEKHFPANQKYVVVIVV